MPTPVNTTESEVTALDHTYAERAEDTSDLGVRLTGELIGQIGFNGLIAAMRTLEVQDDTVPDALPAMGISDGNTQERVRITESISDSIVAILRSNGGSMEFYRLGEKLARRHRTSFDGVMSGYVFAETRGTIVSEGGLAVLQDPDQ